MIKLFENKNFLLLLIIINLFAGFFSISYYLHQLDSTNFLFWIFVIDCPLSAIIFSIALFFKFKKIDFPFIYFIAIIGNIKFGLWTIFVLFTGGFLLQNPLLFLSHILLLIEVIVLYKNSIFKIKHFILALFWFLLNDFFDYVFLTHPYFSGNFEIIAIFSVISTILVTFFVSIFFSR